VRNAELKDGLLSIELEREIPEAMKPRRIDISGGDSRKQISDRQTTAINENENDSERAAA
jgi:molecular chaperone IbpA